MGSLPVLSPLQGLPGSLTGIGQPPGVWLHWARRWGCTDKCHCLRGPRGLLDEPATVPKVWSRSRALEWAAGAVWEQPGAGDGSERESRRAVSHRIASGHPWEESWVKPSGRDFCHTTGRLQVRSPRRKSTGMSSESQSCSFSLCSSPSWLSFPWLLIQVSCVSSRQKGRGGRGEGCISFLCLL